MTTTAPIASTHHTRDLAAASTQPEVGWHCSHLFYRWDRSALESFTSESRLQGVAQFLQLFDGAFPMVTQRLQLSIVAGHRADFGVMMMDPDPLRIDGWHQALIASPLGRAIVPCFSFVSISEVSEYVPTVEQFGARLKADGLAVDSPTYVAKMEAYASREEEMRKQRLWPDFPQWPVTCFYPMNKRRDVGANWFTLPFEKRAELMAQHGKSGMAYAGKVAQLITVAVGLDDWEWGVTLWARNPQYLKEIVYRMRFDEASALYAEFGPFYTSYPCNAETLLRHCRIAMA
jgi:hydrogen peroxide-dependent heme synthase